MMAHSIRLTDEKKALAESFTKSWFGFWRKKKPTFSKSTNNNTASTEREQQ